MFFPKKEEWMEVNVYTSSVPELCSKVVWTRTRKKERLLAEPISKSIFVINQSIDCI
jgi:hypothetical protein